MCKTSRLLSVLSQEVEPAIAVSGGVDSLTLAAFAYANGRKPKIVHGLSPAVPEAATQRVKSLGQQEGWNLQIVDAGEFGDPNYKANPVNRCYFCKANLYNTIAGLWQGPVYSGANMDDLSDYRPGLDAAKERQVRHPYIEAGMDKSDVRQLARQLGLGQISELPASPCLASRVETGIAIQAPILKTIDHCETWLRQHLPEGTIRCRYRRAGWVIELDETSLLSFQEQDLMPRLRRDVPGLAAQGIETATYKRGSAFLRELSN